MRILSIAPFVAYILDIFAACIAFYRYVVIFISIIAISRVDFESAYTAAVNASEISRFAGVVDVGSTYLAFDFGINRAAFCRRSRHASAVV